MLTDRRRLPEIVAMGRDRRVNAALDDIIGDLDDPSPPPRSAGETLISIMGDSEAKGPQPPPLAHQQTRLGSVLETIAGTAIGFAVSVAIGYIVYPAYGMDHTLAANFEITAIFTVASLARGYIVRRVFTRIKRLHK